MEVSDYQFIKPLFISPFGQYSIAPTIYQVEFGFGATQTASWPTANKAFYIPFTLPFNYPVQRMFVANSAVAGNLDIGIYSWTGNRIYSAGSTAMSGASAPQYFTSGLPITLPAGRYYMAFSASSTSAVFYGWSPVALNSRMAGILQETSALPLAASATFGACSGTILVPLFGITLTGSGY